MFTKIRVQCDSNQGLIWCYRDHHTQKWNTRYNKYDRWKNTVEIDKDRINRLYYSEDLEDILVFLKFMLVVVTKNSC